jgi:hypothetical protein
MHGVQLSSGARQTVPSIPVILTCCLSLLLLAELSVSIWDYRNNYYVISFFDLIVAVMLFGSLYQMLKCIR